MIFIDKSLFVELFFSFIAITIIGTVSHEFGHWFMAKRLGYDATIHYAFTSIKPNLLLESAVNRLLINSGGVLQTILTGSTGFALLLIYRQSYRQSDRLKFKQWVVIFLSLFWLRQVANMIIWIYNSLFTQQFLLCADEAKIAYYLHLPLWSVIVPTGLIGIIILIIIIFRFIPFKSRLTFIAAGIGGGISGYTIWIIWIGKYLIP